ncbi:sodium:solute symporter family protein [Amycolatopsis echigonensis]|uniref:Sodium:solute symporter family protein n=1 Tax=Amycolatopsis echigonensis TaxID=2576905 RepID=A0A8E1W8Q5_9PSEU|nr:sodium:solute symporter family protein [Amycolatopsis echigonensis]MBB2505677.1 sodium:solute symporter family protein [Amycolatopsis echigonensis]
MPGSAGVTAGILAVGVLVVLAGAVISIYFGRRAKTAGDWLSARESLPLPVVVITQFAAAAGGGVLVAHVGIAYAGGWAVFIYEFCVLAGFVILAIIAKWLRANEFQTLPDVLARLYGGSRPLAVIAGLAALFLPFGWVCTQFGSFASLFGQLTGYPKAVLVALVLIGSVAFVLPGGLTSVAWTDFFFGIIKIVLALGLAGYCVYLAGGWSSIAHRVPAGLSAPSSLGTAGQKQIWLWVAAIIPSTLSNQIYFQRVFATKKLSQARLGLVLAGATMLVSGVYALLIGLAVRALKPGLRPESAAGWLLTQLPPAILIVFGAFMVAMIVSVSGAALQSAVTSVVSDLKEKAFHRIGTDRSNVSLSRKITVVLALAAGVVSLLFPSVLAWMVAIYAYSASVLTVPIFAGYALSKRYTLTPRVAVSAMMAGLVACTVANIADTTVPYVAYGLAASLCGLVVAILLDPSAGRRPVRSTPRTLLPARRTQ